MSYTDPSLYESFVHDLPVGCACHKALVDGVGKAVDYEFIMVNKAFAELAGLDGENLVGKKVSDLSLENGDFAFDWAGCYGAILSQNEVHPSRHYSKPLNRWYEVKAYSPRNGYLNTLFLDVSGILNESRAALAEAKGSAEARDCERLAILGSMNHEMRSLLGGIMGSSEVLLTMTDGEITGDSLREFSTCIFQSANQLLSIFEDMFGLAMAEQGTVSLRKEQFPAAELLSDSIMTLENIIGRAEKTGLIEAVVHPDPEVLKSDLFLDRGKLNQILKNLFKNAVKFTTQGEIEFGLQGEERGVLTVYVRDTGIGVPKDKQKTIFEFFSQGGDAIRKKYGGSGIGLAISERIAHAMDVKLWLESEEGKGSVFYLKIPSAVLG